MKSRFLKIALLLGLFNSQNVLAVFDDGSCDNYLLTAKYELINKGINYACYNSNLIYQELTPEVKKAKYVFLDKEYNYKNMQLPLTDEHLRKSDAFYEKLSKFRDSLERDIKNNSIKSLNSYILKQRELYIEFFDNAYYNKEQNINVFKRIDDVFLKKLEHKMSKEQRDEIAKSMEDRFNFLKLLYRSYYEH